MEICLSVLVVEDCDWDEVGEVIVCSGWVGQFVSLRSSVLISRSLLRGYLRILGREVVGWRYDTLWLVNFCRGTLFSPSSTFSTRLYAGWVVGVWRYFLSTWTDLVCLVSQRGCTNAFRLWAVPLLSMNMHLCWELFYDYVLVPQIRGIHR